MTGTTISHYCFELSLDWFDVPPDEGAFIVSEAEPISTSHFAVVDSWFEYLEQIAPHPY